MNLDIIPYLSTDFYLREKATIVSNILNMFG